MDGISVASGTAGLITLALQISGTIRDYVVAARKQIQGCRGTSRGEIIGTYTN